MYFQYWNKRLQYYDWWKKPFWSTNKENIRKIATGQGDDCLLDYLYFKKYYKMIAVDLS